MELTRMTAAELSAALQAREISATEVTQAHLDRIAAVDDRVHAFLHVAADRALEQAAAIDQERKQGTGSSSRYTLVRPVACDVGGIPSAATSWTCATAVMI